MKCATPVTVYACSNSSTVFCTKVALSTVSLSANTTCATSDLVVLTQPEYSALKTADTNAQSTGTTNTAALTSVQSDIALLKAWSGVGQSVPNTDLLVAQTALFGATLAVCALVWGARKVLDQFKTQAYE